MWGFTRAVNKNIEVAGEGKLKYAKKTQRIQYRYRNFRNPHIKFKFNSNKDAIIERAIDCVTYAKSFVRM